MSLRVDTSSLISGAIVCGHRGLGVLAETIPATGDNGASFLYNDVSLPSDNGKEICGRITTWPSAGTLYAYENGSFEFSNAPDGPYSFAYQLYVDGAATGSPTTVALQVGSPSAVFALTADDAAFAGGAGCGAALQIAATTDDTIFSGGAFMAGTPATCVFSPTTDDVVFAGAASVVGTPASCSFAIVTSDAVFSGSVVSLATVWPLASDVRLGVVYGPTGVEYIGTMAEGGGSYPTADQIAAAVLAAMQTSSVPIPSNATHMNGAEIVGDGTVGNRWRGVGVPP